MLVSSRYSECFGVYRSTPVDGIVKVSGIRLLLFSICILQCLFPTSTCVHTDYSDVNVNYVHRQGGAPPGIQSKALLVKGLSAKTPSQSKAPHD